MKHPKLLGAMALALFLVLNNSCGKDDPCKETTFYLDNDGDGEGDSAKPQMACEKPDKHVANANDPDDSNANIFSGCTKVTYYLDNDGDSFGDPNQSLELCDGVTVPEKYVTDNTDPNDADNNDPECQQEVTYYEDKDGDGHGNIEAAQTICSNLDTPSGYVSNSDDCDDLNGTFYPEGPDHPNDGIDSNCDGTEEPTPTVTIWNGQDIQFSKASNADWHLTENQDQLTADIIITRQNGGPIYNFQWWQSTFGQDAEHDVNENFSDLLADFYGDSDYAVLNYEQIDASGGTKGIKWALLDPGLGNYPNQAWEDFNFYGTLGDPTNFYSFKNLYNIINMLHYDESIMIGIKNEFQLLLSLGIGYGSRYDRLVGKQLALWLVEENIYLTLTFESFDMYNDTPGGAFSYTRSTPN
ncbi:hypothetical protein F8C76_04935 [Flagellimonas olearia]|uniref:Uncharacterized protein n=1 Tax=Flagellimonas olearia TaxID=552546 RepID=A0A6I1E4S1_9FLAO|nr:hypothetical protein [Allomuricauda olearia]KAB7530845.1 hypothetical protein F8C76_04935 [Allomuricauda olearia]